MFQLFIIQLFLFLKVRSLIFKFVFSYRENVSHKTETDFVSGLPYQAMDLLSVFVQNLIFMLKWKPCLIAEKIN